MKAMTSRTLELKKSRAALSTIQMAVDAVAGAVKEWSALQKHLCRAHQEAVSTFQAIHPQPFKGRETLEESAGELARRLVWPKCLATRSPHDHPKAPMTFDLVSDTGRWAFSTFMIADCVHVVVRMLDRGFGVLVEDATHAARSELSNVTELAPQFRTVG
jgi:hypothetical protein